MSLSDLKRKAAAKKQKKVDIDDFIEDATAYAQGQSILHQPKQKSKQHKRKYKNATFTLSPAHIEQLNHLAQSSGYAKSRILRLLIEKLSEQDDENINEILALLNDKSLK